MCLAALLGVAIFDRRRLLALQPGWVDLPILVFCLAPFAASLTSGLGVYDGLSAVFERGMAWGVPYALGRMYFSDLAGLSDLAWGILIGGLIYVPLALIEISRGPIFHQLIYGYFHSDLEQAVRFGGWRPVVFMDHGLMVALWLVAASAIGLWLQWVQWSNLRMSPRREEGLLGKPTAAQMAPPSS